jgi:probable selenium-dependent hydroxylase accessory protein YqeC
MRFIEALGLREKEVISLVGGGGKTTLMFALARELSSMGQSVITTTTTRILEPSSDETPQLIIEKNAEIIADLLRNNLKKYKHVTLAAEKLTASKLKGISPELIGKLVALKLADYIIVEADGAAGRPLKAPNATEPVIPASTTLVVPVVGIDALNSRLTDESVFRVEIASRLLGIPLGSIITPRDIAALITHPQGILKGSPEGVRIVPFINKMDREINLDRGQDIAHYIWVSGYPGIDTVVLGQARAADPVACSLKSGSATGLSEPI